MVSKLKEVTLRMIAERRITTVMEALIIEMALKIAVTALQSEEAFERFDIGKVLICRSDQLSLCSACHSRLDIFEQQNKPGLLDEAD